MNQSAKAGKTNKALYVSFISVLFVLALIVIATGIISRRRGETTDKEESSKIQQQTLDSVTTQKPDLTIESKISDHEYAENNISDIPETEAEEKKQDPPMPKINNTVSEDVLIEEVIEESLEHTEEAIPTAVEESDVLPTFIAPTVGYLDKAFNDSVPVYSVTMNDYRTHTGIDIATEFGREVMASADGVIEKILDDPMMGRCISISHNGNAVSTYSNLISADLDGITVGTAVKAGTVIGAVGESALVEVAQDPHLHFELTVNGKSVDPTDYFTLSGESTAE